MVSYKISYLLMIQNLYNYNMTGEKKHLNIFNLKVTLLYNY